MRLESGADEEPRRRGASGMIATLPGADGGTVDQEYDAHAVREEDRDGAGRRQRPGVGAEYAETAIAGLKDDARVRTHDATA